MINLKAVEESKKRQHTPTLLPLSFDGFGLNISDEYASRILTFAKGVNNDLYGPYIVKAVNCHEQLLKALKRVHKALTQNSGPEARSTFEMCQVIQETVEEAIAKAEGK